MVNNRTGLIVWMRSLKQVKSLKRFGNIHYVSKNMQYVVLYCDARSCDHTLKELRSMTYVKHVQKSLRAFLETDFDKNTDLSQKESLDSFA